MKKYLLAAAAALLCAFATASVSSAQTALFIYDDHSGPPAAGTYTPGSSFTFSINLAYTPGGSVPNLAGLSYWFQQTTPAGAPFSFAITLRDATGSQFSDLQTSNLTYPQALNPSNPKDLGGFRPSLTGVGAGTYFIADITVSIADTAPVSGTFVLSSTFAGGKTSVISDDVGHTFAIPEADYVVTMVPEPATWLTPALLLAALLFAQRRRVVRLARVKA
jgi:hypothetical protein